MNKKLTILMLLSAFTLLAFCKNKENKEVNTENSTLINNEEPKQSGYQIGSEAADFSLENVNNETVSLKDYPSAKGFIVIFTCNHCPYAKAYEDRINALDSKYASEGYSVIAINPNDPAVQPEDGFKEMQQRAKEKNFTFPYLFDEGQKVYPIYGATKTPHVFLLNKEEQDKLIVKYIGAIDNNYEDSNDVSERYVEDAVDALLAGTAIGTTKSLAIGCTIKTK